MKTCKICGKAMDDSFNVCPYCSAPVNGGEEKKENINENNTYQQPQFTEQESYYQPNFDPNTNPYSQQFTPPKAAPSYTPAPRPQRSAYIAAFLAIFGGIFGLHHFYLDNNKKGIIHLVVSVLGFLLTFGIATIVILVLSIIDAIKILKGEINTDGSGHHIKMGW